MYLFQGPSPVVMCNADELEQHRGLRSIAGPLGLRNAIS